MTNQNTEGADPVARFAAELRELRARAGSPTFREMAQVTHYSASTLAEATAGRRLPTEAVAAAFARACGADPDEWAEKVRRTASTIERSERRDEVIQEPVPLFEPLSAITANPALRRRIRTAGIAAVGCCLLVAGALIGVVVKTSGGSTSAPPPPATTPASTTVKQAVDGTDPHLNGCYATGHLVDKAPLMLDGTQIGALEYWYSTPCGAGWARAYLYPVHPSMLAVVTVNAADHREDTFGGMMVKQLPVYTDVITPGAGRCLATSVVAYPAHHAPVSASMPCEAP